MPKLRQNKKVIISLTPGTSGARPIRLPTHLARYSLSFVVFAILSLSCWHNVSVWAQQDDEPPPMQFEIRLLKEPDIDWGQTEIRMRERKVILAVGVIDPGAPARLRALVTAHPELLDNKDWSLFEMAKHRSRPTVYLHSGGGRVNAGLELGRMIRAYGWTTELLDGTVCASSCTLVFLGGMWRFAAHTSYYGLHQFFRTDRSFGPQDLEEGQKGLADIAVYAREMGVDAGGFVERWVRADRDNVYIMSPDEMIRLGVVTGGFAQSETKWEYWRSNRARSATGEVTVAKEHEVFRGWNVARPFKISLECYLSDLHITLEVQGNGSAVQLSKPVMVSSNTVSVAIDDNGVTTEPPGFVIPPLGSLEINIKGKKELLRKAWISGDEISVSFGNPRQNPLTRRLELGRLVRFNADMRPGREKIAKVLEHCQD
jgi:ATP-dependent protease ClpP protease subunit